MVELRKRKAPAEPAPPPPSKKKSNPVKSAVNKAKAAVTGNKRASTNGTDSPSDPVVGSTITLEHFGGEVETNDGNKTSLKILVDESEAGVVLFTYPKASTPGCTNQACMFRDDYTPLTATGFSIFGLSRDSPKANTTFKTKQNLPYALLCDPSATLIGAIGMKKAQSGTTRGVFVVDKGGKVLVAEAGGPAATVEAVKKVVIVDKGSVEASAPAVEEEKAKPTEELPTAESSAPEPMSDVVPSADSAPDTSLLLAPVPSQEDTDKANVAADVADSAAKLDKGKSPGPASAQA